MASINKDMTIRIGAEDRASAVLDGIGGRLAKIVTVAAAVTAAFKFVKSSIQEAADEQQTLKRLEVTVTNMGVSWEEAKQRLVGFGEKQEEITRFSHDRTFEAMQRIMVITQDYGSVLRLTTIAQNLAASGMFDLEMASTLVGKAAVGATEMFGRYGISAEKVQAEFGKFASEADKSEKYLLYFERHFSGKAIADLDTYSGKVDQLRNYWARLQETVGEALLPVLGRWVDKLKEWATDPATTDKLTEWANTFATALEKIASFVINHGDAIIAFFATLAGAKIITGLVSLAAQLGTIVAILSNPLFLGLAAGAGAFALALNRSNQASAGYGSQIVDPMGPETAERFAKLNEGVKILSWNLSTGKMDWVDYATAVNQTTTAAGNAGAAIKKLAEDIDYFHAEDTLWGRRGMPPAPKEDWRVPPGQITSWNRPFMNFDFSKLKPEGEEEDAPEKRLTKLQQLSLNFASTFQSRLAGVFSRIRSLADLAALKIKDIFDALGGAIMDMLAQVAARMAAMGLLKLASMIIPGGGAFFAPIIDLIAGTQRAGGGIPLRPGGGSSPMPAPAPVSYHFYFPNVIGVTPETANQIGREINRQVQMGQSSLSGAYG